MNIKLGDNYNLLVSSHFDEIFLINSDEDIRSISGEGIEDVYKIISWVKENKIISRDEVISFFKEYDLEYVNNIVDWLLDEEIFIIEDDTIDKICVFFCCDEKIVSLIKENNNSSIFINNIDSLQGFKTIDLLVVIYPFAGLKNIYQEIDKFSLNRDVKTLYVDLYEKSISIGPLMSLKEGTCSLECLITRRLNNAQDSIKFKKFIDNNFVKVNSKIINKNGRKLKLGEKIEVLIPEEENIDIEAENIPLDVVYENDDFIVINKNYGMVVHPAYGNYTGTLVNALLYYTNNLSSVNGNIRPGIIHRLDKDTSGLILIAKNNFAHAKLASMFIDKTIHKTYLCIVKGNFSEENLSGRIENLIGRDIKDRKKMAVVKENGKIAISNYRVIEQVEGYSLVEVAIETGRTHQIRVHMKSINHVILGDSVYGTEDKNVKRQMLHAYKLEFLNPLDNKEYVFKGKLFNDFIEVAKKLKFNIEKYLNK